MLRFSIAFALFFSTLKISKLLQFNRRIRVLSKTLGHAAWPLLQFNAMFVLYFLAFIFIAHVWFEQKLYTFSAVYLTVSLSRKIMLLLLSFFFVVACILHCSRVTLSFFLIVLKLKFSDQGNKLS